jgi:hypothetical protein
MSRLDHPNGVQKQQHWCRFASLIGTSHENARCERCFQTLDWVKVVEERGGLTRGSYRQRVLRLFLEQTSNNVWTWLPTKAASRDQRLWIPRCWGGPRPYPAPCLTDNDESRIISTSNLDLQNLRRLDFSEHSDAIYKMLEVTNLMRKSRWRSTLAKHSGELILGNGSHSSGGNTHVWN